MHRKFGFCVFLLAPALLGVAAGPGAARVRTVNPSDPWLFIAGQRSNSVNAYDLVQPGTPLVETITQGVNVPTGLTFDSAGTLFVSNAGGNVTVYPAGQTTPSLTLGVRSPVGVALDRRGNVFVATRDNPPTILVFRPGRTHPFRAIVNSLLVVPSQIAFGRDDALYISDNNTGVSVMKAASNNIVSLGLQGLNACPTGIAVDQQQAELFVSGCDGGTQVYALGNTQPIRSLNETFHADNIAIGWVHRRRTIFAPDLFSSTVTLYRASDNNPFETLNTASQQALGIALKPEGVP